MIYAYIRVSTDKQKEDSQESAISLSGYVPDHWFRDTCSRSIPFQERPQGKLLWEMVHPGDLIVVYSWERFGEGDTGIQSLVELNEKKVSIRSIRECGLTTMQQWVDMLRDSHKKIQQIRDPIRRGVEAAKQKGIHCGRPSVYIPTDVLEQCAERYANGEGLRGLAREFNLTRSTLRRKLQDPTSWGSGIGKPIPLIDQKRNIAVRDVISQKELDAIQMSFGVWVLSNLEKAGGQEIRKDSHDMILHTISEMKVSADIRLNDTVTFYTKRIQSDWKSAIIWVDVELSRKNQDVPIMGVKLDYVCKKT